MDKALVKILSAELFAAAQEIAKRHGITASRGNGRYDSTTFTTKIEFGGTNASGDNKLQAAWKTYHSMLGLENDWLGQEVYGKTIIGLDMKKRKYPVILKGPQGGQYKIDVQRVQLALKNRPAPKPVDNTPNHAKSTIY